MIFLPLNPDPQMIYSSGIWDQQKGDGLRIVSEKTPKFLPNRPLKVSRHGATVY